MTHGRIAIVDNAGDDEFTTMGAHDIVADLDFWRAEGFHVEIIETAFEFESMDDARRLLTFYFEEGARPALEVEFRVAVMVKDVRG